MQAVGDSSERRNENRMHAAGHQLSKNACPKLGVVFESVDCDRRCKAMIPRGDAIVSHREPQCFAVVSGYIGSRYRATAKNPAAASWTLVRNSSTMSVGIYSPQS